MNSESIEMRVLVEGFRFSRKITIIESNLNTHDFEDDDFWVEFRTLFAIVMLVLFFSIAGQLEARYKMCPFRSFEEAWEFFY